MGVRADLSMFLVIAKSLLIPGRPLRCQSIPSNARRTHRATKVARFGRDPGSKPTVPGRFPCGESSPAPSDCHFSQDLSVCGTGRPWSDLSRPWECSPAAPANRQRLADREETWSSPLDGKQSTAAKETLFRQNLASRSSDEDDCRLLVK